MAANLVAFLGVYGGAAFLAFVSWRLYGAITLGKSFFPHPRLSQRQAIPEMASQVLEAAAEAPLTAQIGKGYNLKEMEGDEFRHVWDIAICGMVHHLYTVYNTHENKSIARDRYIEHGWFTSTEYEYLIGPENPGKQSTPGLLRRAGMVKTLRANGQPATTVLTLGNPIDAIVELFAYLDEKNGESEAQGYIADINGTSYLIPDEELEEVEAPY